RPSPAVIAKTATTRAVPMMATTRSMRSSRDRIVCTWCATETPQEGQRPPGFRTRGAPHPGHSIRCRTGTRRTVPDAVAHAKRNGFRTGQELGGVGLPQVIFRRVVGAELDHLPRRLRLPLDGTQPPSQVLALDAEHIADVLEGEDPRALVALDPLLRIMEHLLAPGIGRPGQLP